MCAGTQAGYKLVSISDRGKIFLDGTETGVETRSTGEDPKCIWIQHIHNAHRKAQMILSKHIAEDERREYLQKCLYQHLDCPSRAEKKPHRKMLRAMRLLRILSIYPADFEASPNLAPILTPTWPQLDQVGVEVGTQVGSDLAFSRIQVGMNRHESKKQTVADVEQRQPQETNAALNAEGQNSANAKHSNVAED
ncbi:hypothetical protein K438DRAFT_1775573 [Mycena galopus ATCC 62051]|nr:hypothetical protein K438DRAFT_1775573 [Mycena galopus ATCC 62051]